MTAGVLAGRVAWVTGGASGIGRAIAEALADAGADVAVGSLLAGADPGALSYLPDDEELGEVEQAVRSRGARTFAGALDVRSALSVSAFHDLCVEALGPVDLLINAAGIGGSEAVAGHREETWTATVDVNLTGSFRTIRACLPSMLERRFGRIVNIASTAASVGAPGLAAYCASKAGIARPHSLRRAGGRAEGSHVQHDQPGTSRHGLDAAFVRDVAR